MSSVVSLKSSILSEIATVIHNWVLHGRGSWRAAPWVLHGRGSWPAS